MQPIEKFYGWSSFFVFYKQLFFVSYRARNSITTFAILLLNTLWIELPVLAANGKGVLNVKDLGNYVWEVSTIHLYIYLLSAHLSSGSVILTTFRVARFPILTNSLKKKR